MKKIVTYLCCLLCILSSIWLGASIFSKNIMQQSLVSIAVEEIHLENKINEFFNSLNIPGKELFANELNLVAKKIAKNETVNKEVNTYLNLVMDDIIYDTESITTSHLNENIKKEIVSYAPDISTYTNHLVGKEEVEVILNAALSNVDFQGVYDTTIMEAKNRLSNTEKLLLRTVRFLETETSQYIALGSVVGLSILVLIMNLHRLTSLTYLSVTYGIGGLSLYALKYLIPLAFNFVLSQDTPNADIVQQANLLGNVGMYFLIAAVVCAIIKVLYNRMMVRN